MKYDHIETNKYIIKIYPENNYLEYIIKPGITLDVEDAIRGKKETQKLYPDMKFFVLAESSEFFNLPKETRRFTSTKEFSDNTLCIAFYTENFSLAILGEMYNKINQPAVPTKIFTNRQNAKEWLNKQAQLYAMKMAKQMAKNSEAIKNQLNHNSSENVSSLGQS